jgi:hypothetical protein
MSYHYIPDVGDDIDYALCQLSEVVSVSPHQLREKSRHELAIK